MTLLGIAEKLGKKIGINTPDAYELTQQLILGLNRNLALRGIINLESFGAFRAIKTNPRVKGVKVDVTKLKAVLRMANKRIPKRKRPNAICKDCGVGVRTFIGLRLCKLCQVKRFIKGVRPWNL